MATVHYARLVISGSFNAIFNCIDSRYSFIWILTPCIGEHKTRENGDRGLGLDLWLTPDVTASISYLSFDLARATIYAGLWQSKLQVRCRIQIRVSNFPITHGSEVKVLAIFLEDKFSKICTGE